MTAAGKPVRGATITLVPGRAEDLDSLPWPPPCIPYDRALRTTTDAAGAFTIPHVRPGRWQVTATATPGAPVSMRVDLAAGSPAVELRLGE